MNYPILNNRNFLPELQFSASRSSGAGGQNVNKVNTKVELRFHLASSTVLTDTEKVLLMSKLANQLTDEGFILVVSQSERTQLGNKEMALIRFYEMLEKALTPRKKRKATRPTFASKERRLESKRSLSLKKANRRLPL
jgi:ribosome-associated protein